MDTPTPFMQGTFALYSLPDGSMVIAYKTEDSEATQQLQVPSYIMAMAKQVGGGDPLSALKAVMA